MTDGRPEADRRALGLRANVLAAVVMLLLQYCLGMWVALYGVLPAGDRGRAPFSAYGAAIADGPVVLALHAILGTLLLLTATAAIVRSLLVGSRPAVALGALALAAIVTAWIAGSRFVGHLANQSSFAMAVATAVALLSYTLVIFLVPGPQGAARS